MTAYRFRRWCGSECGGGGRTCAPSGVKRWQADERERYQSEIKMPYELKIKTRKLLGTKLDHGLHARRPRDPESSSLQLRTCRIHSLLHDKGNNEIRSKADVLAQYE